MPINLGSLTAPSYATFTITNTGDGLSKLSALLAEPPVPLGDLPIPAPRAITARVDDGARRSVMARLNELVGLLASFDSAERIRLHLRNTGITAHIGSTRECMVARFFREHHGLAVNVNRSSSYDPETGASVAHPAILTEFIAKFDRGEYPELVAADSPFTVEDAHQHAIAADKAKTGFVQMLGSHTTQLTVDIDLTKAVLDA